LSKGWLAWYPVNRLGLWVIWKGTSCMDWDVGWIRKVPGVQIGFVVSSYSNPLRIGSWNV
jgi:hypothetical protein